MPALPRAASALVLAASALVAGCGPNLVELGRRPTAYGGCCGIVWLVLAATALLDIWKRDGEDDTNKVLWTAIIVFVPIAGAIAYHLFKK